MYEVDLFLSSLRPFVWVAKIYGAFPFQLESTEVKISICGTIYGGILCGAVIALSLYTYLTIDMVDYEGLFLYRVAMTYAIFCCTIGALCYLIFMTQMCNIRKLYEKSLSYVHFVNNRNFRKKVCIVLIGEIIFWFSINIVYHVQYQFYLNDLGIYSNDYDEIDENTDLTLLYAIEIIMEVLGSITEHYLITIIALINFQFSNIALFYSALFKVGNNDLKAIMENNKSSYVMTEDLSKRELAIISSENNITKLVDFYDQICDLCGYANKFFNGSLLIMSLLTLICVLQSAYFIAIGSSSVGIFVSEVSHICVSFWWLLRSCESVMTESRKTGPLVHKLLGKTQDQQLKKQLQQFSLQLLHRKIKFLACGLVPFNYTLIYSIAGLVTTYLVILIQFQDMEDKRNNGTLLPDQN